MSAGARVPWRPPRPRWPSPSSCRLRRIRELDRPRRQWRPGRVGGPDRRGQGLRVQVRPGDHRRDGGSVDFHVTNTGTEEHEFEIFKGETVVDEIEGLVPGLDRHLVVTLDAGDYTYVCKLPGHEEQGMKGTLTVSAS